MIGIGISPFGLKPPASGIPTQAEATALFAQWDALGTSASASRKTIVNATIYYLKQAGIWTELDCLFMWAAHSQTAALVDWKNPSTRTATVTNDYAGAFVADSYFKGNGSNFRINTGYNPGDGGTYKFTRNDNSLGIYISETSTDTNKIELSAQDATPQGNDLLVNNSSGTNQFILKNNGTTQTSNGANINKAGLYSTVRTASNNWTVRCDGYNIQSGSANLSSASVAVVNADFKVFCRNQNGTYSAFSSKKHRLFYAGSSTINPFTLNKIIEQYYFNEIGLVRNKRVTFNGNSFTSAGVYTRRVIDNIGTYSTLEVNSRGVSGQTTTQMQTDAVTWVFPFTKSYLTKDIYFVWELTNDFDTNGSNVTTTYNNMVTYLQALRAAVGTSAKIIVATMLPRGSVTNSNRQNDGNLTDDSTLNGKIRNHLVQDGYCDAICDVASDATMGVYSNGVAGVGEKNTTYYNVDEIHPTTTGYQYLADNYITASIQAYLL